MPKAPTPVAEVPAPREHRPAHPRDALLRLQRRYGNRLARGIVQAKLNIGPVDDPLEREADRISRLAMEAPASAQRVPETVQRVPAATGGVADAAISQAVERARGGGRAVPRGVRERMEQVTGADFGGVRVHVGGESDRLNTSLGSRAFTVGSDVFVSRSEYHPGSARGDALLSHELTHTVQQGAVGSRSATSAHPAGADVHPMTSPSNAGNDRVVQRQIGGEAKAHDRVLRYEQFAGQDGATFFEIISKGAGSIMEQTAKGPKSIEVPGYVIRREGTEGKGFFVWEGDPSYVRENDPEIDKFFRRNLAESWGADYLRGGYSAINALSAALVKQEDVTPKDLRIGDFDPTQDLSAKDLGVVRKAWRTIGLERNESQSTIDDKWDEGKMTHTLLTIKEMLARWDDFADPAEPADRTLYRGDSIGIAESYPFINATQPTGRYPIGYTFTTDSFWSTTDADPATHNYINRKMVVWKIEVPASGGSSVRDAGGRNLGSGYAESEVTFPIGTQVRVNDVFVRSGPSEDVDDAFTGLGNEARVVVAVEIIPLVLE